MTELEKLLIKVATLLERLKIPYLVTGGVAVVFWGKPRFTADIDVVIELTQEKIPQLIQRLRQLGKDVYADEEMAREALEHKSEFNIIYPESGLKVDFWIIPDETYHRLKMKRARIKKIRGQRVRFVSPEDLILAKLQWYKESESSRHLEDATSVMNIRKNKLDLNYIKKWAKKQSTIRIFNKLQK